jgi:hypothetical protein
MAELGYSFEIKEKSGREVKETEYRRSLRKATGGSWVLFTLKPGETLEEDAEVTKLFDLGASGTYEIQASREEHDPSAAGTYLSNKLEVRVTP